MAVPTAEQIFSQIQGLEGQIQQGEQFLPRAASDIRQEIGRLTDFGAPVLKDTARIQEQAYRALPQALETFQATPEGDRRSALSALGGAIGQFGGQLGLRDAFANIGTRQGQRIEDIMSGATEAYRAPFDLASQRIGRLTPLFQTQTGVEEAARGRKFQTGERLGAQEFQKGERLGSQQFATGERLGAQEFTAEQNEIQQKYNALEAAKQRAFSTGEREAAQGFQAEQDRLMRDFQAIEGDKNRAAQQRAAAASRPAPIDIEALLRDLGINIDGGGGDGGTHSFDTVQRQGISPEEAARRSSALTPGSLSGGSSRAPSALETIFRNSQLPVRSMIL